MTKYEKRAKARRAAMVRRFISMPTAKGAALIGGWEYENKIRAAYRREMGADFEDDNQARRDQFTYSAHTRNRQLVLEAARA